MRHNEGLVRSTKSRKPFIVHYFEVLETKTEALKEKISLSQLMGITGSKKIISLK
jgi:hypothetical protein